MAEHAFPYVLVGGGLASASAAEAIRKADANSPILIVGSEKHPPYNRPPLSKEHLRGEETNNIPLLIHPEAWYKDNNVTLFSGVTAVGGDVSQKAIVLDNGDTVRYQKLLVATGASPKPLDIPGVDSPHVHTLRTWDDSDKLHAHLGQKLILVGGGYIGVEVAAGFLMTNGQATIIEPTDHLWSKFASPEYGAFLKAKLEAAGAEIILGDEVTEIIPTGVRTKQGREITGDVVLVAVGVAPNLAFGKALGLDIDDQKNGILANEYLETSAADVYAAGDVAGFSDPILGKQWRVEHWNNALWHGEIAGANMAGGRVAYDHIPHFFSDELDIDFKLYGDPQGGKGGLFHGTVQSGRFDELYLTEDGRVAMVISVNPPDDLLPTLDALVRQKPSVRGREAEVQNARFNLQSLLTA